MQPMAYGLLARTGSTPCGARTAAATSPRRPAPRCCRRTADDSLLDAGHADAGHRRGRPRLRQASPPSTSAALHPRLPGAERVRPGNVRLPIPAPANGAVKDLSLSPFTLTGMSVSATTKNRDGAIKWLKYWPGPTPRRPSPRRRWTSRRPTWAPTRRRGRSGARLDDRRVRVRPTPTTRATPPTGRTRTTR